MIKKGEKQKQTNKQQQQKIIPFIMIFLSSVDDVCHGLYYGGQGWQMGWEG